MPFHVVSPVGKKGENFAVKFLENEGYKIIERNFRKHYGEIDIIVVDRSEKEPILVFIEVKTRTSSQFGTPLESITFWKLKPLLKTAQLYATEHPKLPQSMRIDAIAVILDPNLKLVDLEHHKNISGW